MVPASSFGEHGYHTPQEGFHFMKTPFSAGSGGRRWERRVVGGRDEAPHGAITFVGLVHDPLHRERKVVGPVHDLSHWIATMWDWRASHALGDADCVASGESRRDFT